MEPVTDPPCYCPGCRPKFAATVTSGALCPLCGHPILEGERITTLTGETWVHDACVEAMPGVDPWCAP